MASLYARREATPLDDANHRIVELEKHLRLALDWIEGASRPPRHITSPAHHALGEESSHGVTLGQDRR